MAYGNIDAGSSSGSPQVVDNGVKLLGEVVLPGASALMENRVARGAIYAGLGLGGPPLIMAALGGAAGAVLGGAMAIGTRFLSFADSLSERPAGGGGLWKKLGSSGSALQVLEERYARGEINTAEYMERRHTLEAKFDVPDAAPAPAPAPAKKS